MDELRLDPPTSAPQEALHDRFSQSCLVVLGLLWLIVLASTVFSGWNRHRVTVADAPPGTLNPNQAAWYELSLLPRLGEAKARAVVTYRENHGGNSVFASPMDLAGVRGIGPKTVERMARELRFKD